MRYVLFSLVLLSAACASTESRDQTINSDSLGEIITNDSLAMVAAQNRADSLASVIEARVAENFALKEQDFPYPTYYHNAWYGIYCVRADVLTVMIDENGELTIISCLDGQDAGGDHNNITVEMADKEYNATQCLGGINGTPGTGLKEYKLFGNDEAWAIATAIAANPEEEIKVYARHDDDVQSHYALSEKDKKAFGDCVKLAKLLKERSENIPAEKPQLKL